MKASELPDFPRLMRADLAAAYVGLSKSAFLAAVKAGRYPEPVRQGRAVAWDKQALDATVDALAGNGLANDEIMEALGDADHPAIR